MRELPFDGLLRKRAHNKTPKNLLLLNCLLHRFGWFLVWDREIIEVTKPGAKYREYEVLDPPRLRIRRRERAT